MSARPDSSAKAGQTSESSHDPGERRELPQVRPRLSGLHGVLMELLEAMRERDWQLRSAQSLQKIRENSIPAHDSRGARDRIRAGQRRVSFNANDVHR